MTSFSQNLQTFLRIILDSTGQENVRDFPVSVPVAVLQQNQFPVSGRELGNAPCQVVFLLRKHREGVIVKRLLVFPPSPLPQEVDGFVFDDNVDEAPHFWGIQLGDDFHIFCNA